MPSTKKPIIYPPLEIKPKEIIQSIEHDLTDAELLSIGDRAAELDAKLVSLQDDFDAEKRQRKASLQRVEHERSVLLSQLRSKTEERDTDCLTWVDERTRRRVIVRKDTHELVLERPLSSEELQMKLDPVVLEVETGQAASPLRATLRGLPSEPPADDMWPASADDFSQAATDRKIRERSIAEAAGNGATAEPPARLRKKKANGKRKPKAGRKARIARASRLNSEAPPG